MRDLQIAREQWSDHPFIGAKEEILQFIDRAISAEKEVNELKQSVVDMRDKVVLERDRRTDAEKERDDLQKRVGELERFMRLIVNTTAHPIPETYSLSGHMNAVEYAKHMLKETHNETTE